MRIDEARRAFDHRDLIAAELRFDLLDLAYHDGVGTEDEVVHGDVFLDGVTATIEGALAQPTQVDHGFAKGLAGDGPGVDADPTDGALLFDDSDPLVQLGRADGSLLSGGTAANDDEIESSVLHEREGRGGQAIRAPRHGTQWTRSLPAVQGDSIGVRKVFPGRE